MNAARFIGVKIISPIKDEATRVPFSQTCIRKKRPLCMHTITKDIIRGAIEHA